MASCGKTVSLNGLLLVGRPAFSYWRKSFFYSLMMMKGDTTVKISHLLLGVAHNDEHAVPNSPFSIGKARPGDKEDGQQPRFGRTPFDTRNREFPPCFKIDGIYFSIPIIASGAIFHHPPGAFPSRPAALSYLPPPVARFASLSRLSCVLLQTVTPKKQGVRNSGLFWLYQQRRQRGRNV